MLITIPDVLSSEEITRVRAALETAKFEDGKATAGTAVRDIKKNLQAATADDSLQPLRTLILNALMRNALFHRYALPLKVLPPMFNRYEPGMEYGDHVDNAIMHQPMPLRSDLSMTIALSSPDEYDGGALVVNSDLGAQSVRLPKGAALVYPSSTVHKVETVKRGTRLAAVTWVQSMVRDHEQRYMLAELTGLIRWSQEIAPGSHEALLIGKLRSNLMRMWAEV